MIQTLLRWTDLRAPLAALALAAVAGCSVSEVGTIPCTDNANCPDASATCSAHAAGAQGKCVVPGNLAKVEIVSGGAQTSTVNTAVAAPLKVLVSDSNGNPFTGATVTWSVAGGAGSFGGAATLATQSGPDGTATATPTLGKLVATNTFKATVTGLDASTALTFNATSTPDVAASFTVTFPTSVVARIATSATVAPFDQFGNPTKYNGTVKVSAAVPDATAVLPQSVALNIAIGDTASISGIILNLATAGQSLIVTDTTNATITGKQTGINVASHGSTTALASNLNPSVYGQAVTLTATVASDGTPADGTPSGTVTFSDAGTPIGAPVALVSGVATLTTSALVAGSHTIKATYPGDLSFAMSSSSVVSQGTAKAATASAVALTTGAAPSTYGDVLTFTATITSAGGTPTGTVTFKEGLTTLGTGTLAAGVATFTTAATALVAGLHSINVVYAGDSNFNGSTSANLSQTVNKAPTVVVLTSSQQPATYGVTVTYTGTVTSTAGVPTGTVTFKDDTTPIASNRPMTSGAANFMASLLTGGSHNLSAVYNGDSNFQTSTSLMVNQVITKAATTTVVSLTSGLNPSTFNDSLTFTAAITSPSNFIITGTVIFKDNGVNIGTCASQLLSSNMATCTISTLGGGTHPITAVFSGDGNYSGSTTASALNQVVNAANNLVTLVTSGTPSVFGQSVTFTATVTSGAGSPTGTVTFNDNATAISTAVTMVAGVATFSTSALSVLPAAGTHPITASYSGDTNFAANGSNTVNQRVNPAPTTVTLAGSGTPTVFGQSVTFTATIAVTFPGAGTPTGSIAFQDNGANIGTCATQTVASNVATCAISTLSVATHPITATYLGDTSFAASIASNTVNQVVNKASTTVTLSGSGTPTVFGQSVTFTATVAVTAPGGGTPAGSIAFKDNGSTIGSCATQAVTASVATCVISTLSVATHPITASYNADASYNASAASNTVSQVVNKASTTVTLAGSGSPSLFGQSVTFSATVAVTAPGGGTPAGTIAFQDNGTTIGSCATQSVTSNVATCVISTLSVATHPITASYNADASYNASAASNTVSQVVNKASTSVTLATSGTPSAFGQSVTFTATVAVTAPGGGTPAGTIAFQDNGSTIGSCATQSVTSLVATCVLSTLSLGTHPITASYNADSSYNASAASNTISQVVNKAATSVALVTSGTPSVFGQAVTFTATASATAPGAGTPTGNIKFQDGGVDIGTCTSQAMTAGVATCVLLTFSVATHPITALYIVGDSNFNPSAASNIVSQVVNKAATTVTLAGSGTPPVFGQSVTFTATVSVNSPGAATPTGTIAFSDNGSPISGCGTQSLTSTTATCVVSNLSVATHPITASYNGDGNLSVSPASNTVSQVVNKASTSVALAGSGTGTTVFGQSVTFTATVSVTAPGGGTPGGAIAFKDNVTTIGTCATQTVASNVATCVLNTTVVVGTHPITATYLGDGSFNASSASNTVTQTVNKASTTVTLAGSGGGTSNFGQSVTFTATVAVTAPGGGTPAGNVAFQDNGTPIGSCATQAVSASTATCVLTTLSVATHPITASYIADASYTASAASNTVNQTVSKGTTTTFLTVTQLAAGAVITFGVTVTATTAGFATGTVNIQETGITIFSCLLANASTPTSTCSVDSGVAPATGSRTFTAVYLGDNNYNTSTSSPVTKTINDVPPPGPTAFGATATSIRSGKVFIAGGSNAPAGTSPSRSTWIYDPATSAMTAGPALTTARAFHTATAIGGGQVLIAGGSAAGSAFELCSLEGGTPSCAPTGGLVSTVRCNAAAALVSTAPARVLVAGGDDCAGGLAQASWDLWDGTGPAEPTVVSSSAANALSQGRKLLTATVIAEGSVLLAGGGSNTADLFQLSANAIDSAVQPVGPMLASRSGHSATLLTAKSAACPAGGCVLLAGGVANPTASTWEIFSASSTSFGRPAGAGELVSALRSQHAAALLSDGRVLLAGGTVDGKAGLASTEYFDPATLRFAEGIPLAVARFGAAAAYAPGQDLLVLSGGGKAVSAPELITAP